MKASHWIIGGVALLAFGAGCKVTVKDDGTGGSTTSSSSKASSSSSGQGSTTGTTSSASGTGGSASSSGVGGAAGCNPVLGNTCDDAAAETCDYNDMSPPEFRCYTAARSTNTGTLCMACDPANGVYCKDGLECIQDDLSDDASFECYRFCCTDADCGGAVGSCNINDIGDGVAVGVCGSLDAGGIATPVCTGIPATPPSNGSCVP